MSYWLKILIALDETLNTLLGGMPGETVSSRIARHRPAKWACIGCKILAFLFRNPKHCDNAIASEKKDAYLPPELR